LPPVRAACLSHPNGRAAQCFGRTVMLTGLLVVTPPALSVARAVRT
jgi:hypothetical protein